MSLGVTYFQNLTFKLLISSSVGDEQKDASLTFLTPLSFHCLHGPACTPIQLTKQLKLDSLIFSSLFRRLSGQELFPSRHLLWGSLLLWPGLDGGDLQPWELHDSGLSPRLQRTRQLRRQCGALQVSTSIFIYLWNNNLFYLNWVAHFMVYLRYWKTFIWTLCI